MNKIFIMYLILSFQLIQNCCSQGINNIWLLGYDSPSPPPFGGMALNFSTGIPIITTSTFGMHFSNTNANISDTNGNLLFSTNGFYVANTSGDTMVNGSGLNPSWYSEVCLGYFNLPQAALIIPNPGNNSQYYIFHSSVDSFLTQWSHPAARFLYYSVVDMDQDSGRGAVLNKNNIIINDTLNIGKITATKHANGRDWWVVCHKMFSKRFYKLLVTPYGIQGPYSQDVGMIRGSDGGQVCFSPDGSRFAYYYSNLGAPGAQLFNFNRCTGNFSQPYLLDVTDSAEAACGVSFSPNSNVIYISAAWKVYQFDCTAPDINASKYMVAEWDSSYAPPGPPLATTFYNSQLAPDGKIYISSSNSVMSLHVINQPDILGPGCNLVQRGLQLPAYNGIGSVPNHPNYFLGPLTGSICDSLTSIEEFDPTSEIKVFPNPAYEYFTISNWQPSREEGQIMLIDMTGRVIYKNKLPKFATTHKVFVEKFSPGIYQCFISFNKSSKSTKLTIVQ